MMEMGSGLDLSGTLAVPAVAGSLNSDLVLAAPREPSPCNHLSGCGPVAGHSPLPALRLALLAQGGNYSRPCRRMAASCTTIFTPAGRAPCAPDGRHMALEVHPLAYYRDRMDP